MPVSRPRSVAIEGLSNSHLARYDKFIFKIGTIGKKPEVRAADPLNLDTSMPQSSPFQLRLPVQDDRALNRRASRSGDQKPLPVGAHVKAENG